MRPSAALALALSLASACTASTRTPALELPAPPSPEPGVVEASATPQTEPAAGALDEGSGAAAPGVAAGEGSSSGAIGDADVALPAAAPAPDPCDLVVEGMACIPAGEFIRGVDSDDHDCGQPDQLHADVPSTSPAMRVEMSAYFMDLTEVTNAAYAACVAAGGCPESGPRYVDFGRDQQPIVGVSWYDAQAYCAWAGKSLPTEAQWEKAARGPDGELTPFGDDPVSCDVAVIMDGGGHRSCGQMKERGEHPETGRVALVGSMPAGRYGLFDMVGNAEEWVADWWTENWTACGADCAGPDPTGPCGGAEECDGYRLRVVRGGSWYWPTGHATGYHRRRHYPANSPFHHFGFRCAASVEQAQALSAAATAN